MARRGRDYTPFFEAVDVMVDEQGDPEDQFHLKTMMTGYNFRKGKVPTTTQVDLAWQHIKGKSPRIVKREASYTETEFVTSGRRVRHANFPIKHKGKTYPKGAVLPESYVQKEIYGFEVHEEVPHLVKRAKQDVKFKGKWYKKGQFVPKDFKVS